MILVFLLGPAGLLNLGQAGPETRHVCAYSSFIISSCLAHEAPGRARTTEIGLLLLKRRFLHNSPRPRSLRLPSNACTQPKLAGQVGGLGRGLPRHSTAWQIPGCVSHSVGQAPHFKFDCGPGIGQGK